MITPSDSFTTYDLGKYYAILPQVPIWNLEEYVEKKKAKRVKEGFHYDSGNNPDFLSVDDLRVLIKKYVG